MKYVTASWRIGSAYCFYVVMNKQKWDSLPADVQKVMTNFSKEFIERWTVEWNNIDIEGREFFPKQGGKSESVSDEDNYKWIRAVQPVIEEYKTDLVSKGHKAAEIDDWINFVNSRILYWKDQERAKNIPTSYQY
jgi:TRAP-type C4-dicarboxylate transport system substrate-binding protein